MTDHSDATTEARPQQPGADRLRCFLATAYAEGVTDDTPILDFVGYTATFGDVREVSDELDRQRARVARVVETMNDASDERDQLRRQLVSAPTVWWLDTGEFDYDPPKLHTTEQDARDAAIKHWRHFNPFPRDAEFAWLQEPDDNPDHPDPNRGFELVAVGRKTGHIVRPVAVQGAPQPNPITAADLLHYAPGIDAGRLALWCTEDGDPTSPLAPLPFWTEDDAAEQVTEFSLANLVGIAEQHEQQHHAEDHKPSAFDFSALVEPTPPPPDPHRVTVRTVRVLGPNLEDDWADEVSYDIEHTPQCDALPYLQSCWLDHQHDMEGTDDWPTEPGVYIATGEAIEYFNGQVTEYDFRIDFEPEPGPLESAVAEARADIAATPAEPEHAPIRSAWLVEAGDD